MPAVAGELASEQIRRIRSAFPEAEVTDFDKLLDAGADLPDKDDAHVLAAAIKAQAATIVTENLADFPTEVLQRYNLEARPADEFIADTISLDEAKAVEVIKAMRTSFKRPKMTSDELFRRMEAQGLLQTVDILRPHASSL